MKRLKKKEKKKRGEKKEKKRKIHIFKCLNFFDLFGFLIEIK